MGSRLSPVCRLSLTPQCQAGVPEQARSDQGGIVTQIRGGEEREEREESEENDQLALSYKRKRKICQNKGSRKNKEKSRTGPNHARKIMSEKYC